MYEGCRERERRAKKASTSGEQIRPKTTGNKLSSSLSHNAASFRERRASKSDSGQEQLDNGKKLCCHCYFVKRKCVGDAGKKKNDAAWKVRESERESAFAALLFNLLMTFTLTNIGKEKKNKAIDLM